jgi:RNA polymerase sigma-70 factor (ECF subfamily)
MKTFEKKLIEHIPGLRRYAAALTGNSVIQPDDLVQDTLERALKKQSLWIRRDKLRSWLFTLMHNIFINQIKHSTINYADISEAEEVLSGHRDDPEQAYFIVQLKQHLNQLPLEQKETLILVSLEGFSYEETALILDVPVGTVMSRIHRGREKLRQGMFNNLQFNKQPKPLRRIK